MVKELKSGEFGGARLKFLVVLAIICVVAYAGYVYIPVAYQAYRLKDWMQHNVDVAATQGYAPAWVGDQLTKSTGEYGIPPKALIVPIQREGRVEVRVKFSKPIEFPGYTYTYEFDHTARSTGFLTIK